MTIEHEDAVRLVEQFGGEVLLRYEFDPYGMRQNSAGCYVNADDAIAALESAAAREAELRAEVERLREMVPDGPCLWMPDDEGTWHSECGNAFVFNDGGPRDNDMDWCCYCGKSLMEHKPLPEAPHD